MNNPNPSELTDSELVALNNILVGEVTKLSKVVNNDTSNDKPIGEQSLSGLISLYQRLQKEIESRSLS
ncbi:hypothetical protein [Shewanella benthica]|uniref:Uncharacterized protein n=1 Tax=Shewanella benthica KT99 TaxID=314608 RepID=A9D7E4_9GAMM|nr:hypothetical protein [Shewanella benthica]EDQ01022.1 hypothetical protein KT99_09988 [Shewanella benthica KT99]EDQ01023.1 hypothetical protein KT99_09993 [Shewanella benthica KT99]